MRRGWHEEGAAQDSSPPVVLSGRSSSICARTPSSASKASHRSSAASRPRAFNRPFGPFPEQITAGCVHDPNSAADHGHLVVLLIQTCFNRQRAGRARLGEINRAVNLSIRATSDLSQYGVADFWSAPLATIEKGAGECEDYAILKYLAYWLQSLVALILRFTARLISPSRARPARWRPSSTIFSNRRAGGEHESGLARQAASVSPSESMRASTSIHFAAAWRAISSAKGSG